MPASRRSLEGEHPRSRWLALAVLLLVGAGVQAAALAAGKIPWNSDQAVVGLMAKHIVELGEHPVFYYGSAYGGTVEPHLIAAVFFLLGPTPEAYHVALSLLLALLLGLVFLAGRRAFGPEAALFAVAYLALPPFFFLLKGLTSDGAYDSLALLGAAMVIAALGVDNALERGRRPEATIALLGLLAGVAWWVDPLAVYFYLAILIWFLLVHPSIYRRWRFYPVFLLPFTLGSLPWWLTNVRESWPSLRVPEAARLPVPEAAKGFVQFWTVGVPVVFGARPFNSWGVLFPGAKVAAFVIYAAPVVFAVLTVLRAAPWSARPVPPDASRVARPLLLLLLLMACMQFLVSWSQRSYESDPRFLFPIYVPFALLAGFSFARLRRHVPRSAGVAVAVAVLAFNALGVTQAPPEDDFMTEPTTGRLTPLLQALEARGLKNAYADYWVAYRLAFESRETVRVAAFGLSGRDRYPPYAEEVARSRNPAVILRGSEADSFVQYLARRGARADHVRVGPHLLFWNLPPDVLSELRALRRVPEPMPNR